MGERRDDGGTPGRRRAHPEAASRGHQADRRGRPGTGPTAASASEPASGPVPGPASGPGPGPASGSAPGPAPGPASVRRPARDVAGPTVADVEALLAGALIEEGVDAGSEQRAVAAFREAREAGAHRTRTRRRDDWRPRGPGLGRFSVRLTLSVLVAGLGLGGVAVAGMGATGTATDGSRQGGTRSPVPAVTSTPSGSPSEGSPDGPSEGLIGEPSAARSPAAGPGAGSLPAVPERALRSEDAAARCRASEKAGGRGEEPEQADRKRLSAAAGGAPGGAANVEAHCAGRSRPASGGARPGGTGAPGDRPGDTADSGNGAGGTDDGVSGRQRASAGPGGGKKP
ncbi:hypothetical protein ACFVZ0_21135 [Streptomyces prasinus]|uniref:hypothetical protein n=1 Tax=Streptomyces prasinus TaxID=67345 RepID=UPI00369ACC09